MTGCCGCQETCPIQPRGAHESCLFNDSTRAAIVTKTCKEYGTNTGRVPVSIDTSGIGVLFDRKCTNDGRQVVTKGDFTEPKKSDLASMVGVTPIGVSRWWES